MSTKKTTTTTITTTADLTLHECGDMAIAGIDHIMAILAGIHSGIHPHFGMMAITALISEATDTEVDLG